MNFGTQVLSHPFVVDAARSAFTPVVIHNNTQGDEDARTLKRFKEPAWNNPVVRIVEPKSLKDVAPRLGRDWTTPAVLTRMVKALKTARREVPGWLRLVAWEAEARRRPTGVVWLGMYCFWAGEAGVGDLNGVVATRVGFLDGGEVVEVRYDPKTLSLKALLEEVKSRQVAERVYCEDAASLKVARGVFGDDAKRAKASGFRASAKDLKHGLLRRPLRFLPMTPLQAARLNAHPELADGDAVLSPAQRALLAELRTHPKGRRSMIGRPFVDAWAALNPM
ncbi:MAG TPA: hypothetical protein ENK43_03865 [Planctomycetes bacterium]|nr:hypothetical protein [Planctomycetota bacterium]